MIYKISNFINISNIMSLLNKLNKLNKKIYIKTIVNKIFNWIERNIISSLIYL